MHKRLRIIATVVDRMTALVKLIDIKNFSAGKQKKRKKYFKRFYFKAQCDITIALDINNTFD